jgi:CBS domain-containing protein
MPKVRDFMTREVVTLTPEMTLREAGNLFADAHVSGAPVVAAGRVAGVVTQSDILAFLAAGGAGQPEGIELRTPEEESRRAPLPSWDESLPEPDSFFSDPWTELGEETEAARLIETEPLADASGYEQSALDAHTVDEVMSRSLCAVRPDADIGEAAEYMRTAQIHRVLVMERDELLGILSTMDLAKAAADHRMQTRVFVFGKHAEDRGAEP